ncbi:MAG: DUF1802 family protein [Candidatus Omnitrophica bacterium]|nr:DUF1802 family protein [Candidatus Omnitrophota bacterium]
MSAIELPPACAVALKEWATVLEAMARGEQLVLIRKGGLIEPGSGFELAAPAFVFYPTFEHQAVNYLRPEFRRYFEEAQSRRAPEGEVRIDLIGAAVSSVQSGDPGLIQRLAPFHVYNEAFVTQRLKWQPDQPLTIVVVRVFRLPSPQVLTVAPRYAGCKSWVDLDAPLALTGAVPALDEAAFQRRLHVLQPLLPPA